MADMASSIRGLASLSLELQEVVWKSYYTNVVLHQLTRNIVERDVIRCTDLHDPAFITWQLRYRAHDEYDVWRTHTFPTNVCWSFPDICDDEYCSYCAYVPSDDDSDYYDSDDWGIV